MARRSPIIFSVLEIPIMCLKDKNDLVYEVYKNAQEYVVVEATTAREALELSQVKRPYKIIHRTYNLDHIIASGALELASLEKEITT